MKQQGFYPTEVDVQVCVARSSTFVSGTPQVELPPPAIYHRDPTRTPACPARAAGVNPWKNIEWALSVSSKTLCFTLCARALQVKRRENKFCTRKPTGEEILTKKTSAHLTADDHNVWPMQGHVLIRGAWVASTGNAVSFWFRCGSKKTSAAAGDQPGGGGTAKSW